jgi:hypothetical protein
VTMNPPMPNKPPRRPARTRTRIGLLLLGVIATAAALSVAVSTADNDTGHAARPDNSPDTPSPLQTCITSWNRNNASKETVGRLATVAARSNNPTAYTTVGFSDLFPDRCMITVANTTTMTAQQYVQESGGTWTAFPAWSGAVNQLDSSVTDWNAEMSQTGTITRNEGRP